VGALASLASDAVTGPRPLRINTSSQMRKRNGSGITLIGPSASLGPRAGV
jgi:hypothetical protein